jgi:ribosomal protein S18 acetylase RimI-like enzyme
VSDDDVPALRPRLRAVVIDARNRDPAASARPDPHPLRMWPQPSPSSLSVDVTVAELPAHHTRDLATGALGVDVIVVIAGPRLGLVAREARVLRAMGARAAVIGMPFIDEHATPSAAEVERNARHLVTGIGLGGDDALAVSLDDVEEAVIRACTPIARDGFVVVGRSLQHRGGRITARGVAGTMPQVVRAYVLDREGFRDQTIEARRGPGDDESFALDIGPHAFRVDEDVIVASEPLVCAKRFVVAKPDVVRSISVEPCAAFGGYGGWANGTVKNGVVDLDRAICPRDGRIGVVLFQGAGLGPVHVVDAFPLAPRRATSSKTDREALFQLMKLALHDQTVATYGAWDEAWQRDRFEKHYATTVTDAHTNVALYEDERGMFAMLDVERNVDDGSLYVVRIYVDPRAQGCGVGSVLMREVIERAKGEKLDVTLRVMRSNVRAKALYERLAFRVDGETDTHFHMRASTSSP